MNACALCLVQFHDQTKLAAHRDERHQPASQMPTISCNSCSAPFDSDSQLQQHLKAGTGILVSEAEIGCKICKETFEDIDKLHAHIRSSARHVHSCVDCLLDFHTLEALQAHIGEHRSAAVLVPMQRMTGDQFIAVTRPPPTNQVPASGVAVPSLVEGAATPSDESPGNLRVENIQQNGRTMS
ncbi:hypothetical protein FRB99_000908 [Tulasnella sp. 403]|nr:hypothetical protein FRB99_000908 [Tulasnella sp. 403]